MTKPSAHRLLTELIKILGRENDEDVIMGLLRKSAGVSVHQGGPFPGKVQARKSLCGARSVFVSYDRAKHAIVLDWDFGTRSTDHSLNMASEIFNDGIGRRDCELRIPTLSEWEISSFDLEAYSSALGVSKGEVTISYQREGGKLREFVRSGAMPDNFGSSQILNMGSFFESVGFTNATTSPSNILTLRIITQTLPCDGSAFITPDRLTLWLK